MKKRIFTMLLATALGSSAVLFAGHRQAIKAPANSPFSHIKNEMSMQRVIDILGEPTSKIKEDNWTALIPLLGVILPGTMTAVYFYQGQGKVVFKNTWCSNSKFYVTEIKYNPDEALMAQDKSPTLKKTTETERI